MAQKKPAGKSTGAGKTPAKAQKTVPAAPERKTVRREIAAVVCLFLGLFSFLGYFNIDAWFIDFFCRFIKGLIGWGFYLFPPTLILTGIILAFHRGRPVIARSIGAMLLPVALGGIVHLLFSKINFAAEKNVVSALYKTGADMDSGGFIAGGLGELLESAFSVYGAIPVLFFAVLVLVMITFRITPAKIAAWLKDRPVREVKEEPVPAEAPVREELPTPAPESEPRRRTRRVIDIPVDDENIPSVLDEPEPKRSGRRKAAENSAGTENVEPLSLTEAADIAGVDISSVDEQPRPAVGTSGKLSRAEVDAEREDITKTIEDSMSEPKDEYQYPPVQLLKANTAAAVDGREEINLNRERLDTTLKSFGVNAAITDVTRGPTVTRYDLELEAGVKLTKLTNLAGDLALSLGVTGVRIAPIPDKISTVGVEVPNKLVSTVYLRDIIDTPTFRNASSKLSFAIGKDIGGNSIVGNIAKLPHLLIAGTTGSGKSVCMNSLILSLLYKATPEEVRLIMVDPKMVELGVYNGIPHLYIPVVTDPKKAAGALQWSVVEMLKRYRLFSEVGVRDLNGYNTHQRKIGEPILPQVVIVIDELADLMLVASKEVEESICRVAQMGRASGMHLVIATQRPSADVITGLMKANIPSRIAFAVSSAMESRIILDAQGAEKLIGCGDMLYAPIGVGKPMRIQGAFVSDEEREEVINFIKQGAQAQYSDEIMAQIERAAEDSGKGGGKGGASASAEPAEAVGSQYDELLPQAVEVIFETKQASVSMLQRRLKLGYSRAARIVDQMEEIGVVGPFEGSKPRQIIITPEQWKEMQYSSGTAPVDSYSGQMELDMEDESEPW